MQRYKIIKCLLRAGADPSVRWHDNGNGRHPRSPTGGDRPGAMRV
jgi:hypothetical protein